MIFSEKSARGIFEKLLSLEKNEKHKTKMKNENTFRNVRTSIGNHFQLFRKVISVCDFGRPETFFRVPQSCSSGLQSQEGTKVRWIAHVDLHVNTCFRKSYVHMIMFFTYLQVIACFHLRFVITSPRVLSPNMKAIKTVQK